MKKYRLKKKFLVVFYKISSFLVVFPELGKLSEATA